MNNENLAQLAKAVAARLEGKVNPPCTCESDKPTRCTTVFVGILNEAGKSMKVPMVNFSCPECGVGALVEPEVTLGVKKVKEILGV